MYYFKFFNFVRTNHLKLIFMGKGDKKTRRGKVTAGSYGKTRPRKSGTSKVAAPKVEAKAEKPKKAVAEEKPKTTRKKKTEE